MNKLLLAAVALAAPLAAQTAVVPPAPPAPPAAPMAMQDHVMTRAEMTDHVARLFARADANRDGAVTTAELQAMGKMAGHEGMMGHEGMAGHEGMMGHDMGAMKRDPNQMFDMIDTNKDGMISRAEFAAHHAEHAKMAGMKPGKMMRMHGGMAGRMLGMADANKDGKVTLAEAQTAAGAHFDRMDTNHDGQVTPEERRAAWGAMRMVR